MLALSFEILFLLTPLIQWYESSILSLFSFTSIQAAIQSQRDSVGGSLKRKRGYDCIDNQGVESVRRRIEYLTADDN